jgi:hypothetical protein
VLHSNYLLKIRDCGYLTAFVVTRNKWRDEMIKRGRRYNWRTSKWEWGEPPKESRY